MARWKITIEYNGAPYSGWQRQKDVPSVQAAIEDALYKFCQRNITLYVAGRTDAGVHAHGQVAHFDLAYKNDVSGFDLMKAVNAHLRPQPISVLHAEIVDDNFHARFNARNKLYMYRIMNRPAFLALDQGTAWHLKKPLNVQAMHDAAQVLLGHHDFSTFRDSQCQAKHPMRTVDRIDVYTCHEDSFGGKEICIEVEGQSFLHHMVRNVVGTLVLVGEGKWSKDDVRKALETKNRSAGGSTAPADGLFLMRIDY